MCTCTDAVIVVFAHLWCRHQAIVRIRVCWSIKGLRWGFLSFFQLKVQDWWIDGYWWIDSSIDWYHEEKNKLLHCVACVLPSRRVVWSFKLFRRVVPIIDFTVFTILVRNGLKGSRKFSHRQNFAPKHQPPPTTITEFIHSFNQSSVNSHQTVISHQPTVQYVLYINIHTVLYRGTVCTDTIPYRQQAMRR